MKIKKIIIMLLIVLIGLSSCNIISIEFNPYTPTLSPTDNHTPTSSPSPTHTPISAYPQWAAADDGIINDPYAPELGNDGYDIKHFDINISLDPAQKYKVLDASVIISLQTTTSLQTLPLDFIGYQISHITHLSDQSSLEYKRENNKLLISFPQTIPAQTNIDIQIDYSGQAVVEESRFLNFAPSVGFFYPDGEHMFIASEPDGARYWLPCNDHPQDKATYTFNITTPQNMRGIANGLLIEETQNQDGTKTFQYQHNHPMASYLATIIVGEFEHQIQKEINGIQINVYAQDQYNQTVAKSEDTIIEAVEWMSQKFGPYPFDSIGYVIIDATGFSLETQTMILIDDQMVDSQTLVHEISHQWFGDSVSLASWHEIWRNEGFATFIHTYYPIKDRSQATIDETFESIRSWMNQENSDFDLDNPPEGNLFHIAEYYKASVVVYDLYNLLGEDAFYQGLQTYFETYQGGTASDQDFWNIMETSSGVNLDEFIKNNFNQ